MTISYKGFMRDKIQREVVTISPDASFYDARTLIRDKGIRHLPVVDKNNHLVGLLTDGGYPGSCPFRCNQPEHS